MELHEKILKIIDTYENGSKSQFAAKTGMHIQQVYKLLKPGHKALKITIDHIISAYPNISVEWLTSGIGDMTIVSPAVEHREEKAGKFLLTELPDHLTAHQVLSHILQYTGIDSLPKLSVKLNVRLSTLNQVYYGTKPMKSTLAQVIHKTFPEIPYQWIKTGENLSVKSQNSPKKRNTGNPQNQSPAHDAASVKALKSIDDKSHIQELELQKLQERILKIVDTCENGSKFHFSAKTGMYQIYRFKPSYQPRKATINRIISVYPNISAEWLTSGVGDMMTVRPDVEHREEKTDQFPGHALTPVNPLELQERILKIVDICENGSKSQFATKTGMYQIYSLFKPDYQPRKATIDHIISVYPNISAEWLTSGIGDMTTVRPDVEHREEKTDQLLLTELPDQIQSPVHDSTSVQTRELQERILKIIDICENGSKYRFAVKTGMQSHIYKLLKPGHSPGQATIDRVISAYPNISVEWLTSGVGDMMTVRPDVERREEKTDQFPVQDPSPAQTTELHERILKIIDTCENGSKFHFAAKTGIRNHIYRLLQPGYKPRKITIDHIISVYPKISVEWLTSGTGDMMTVRPDVERQEEKTDQFLLTELSDQIQSPVHDSTLVQTMKSIDNKSYIQELELQIQTILKINEGLLLDYQKAIEINLRLNNAVMELTEKVIGFNSKI
ncbi:MAG: hypothetical protein LBM08_01190 [Dysgonamonadaceae bacterium]|jgi:DNA-binding phage protein|nr:hypothetical protein [Dysgonamonadaceae bacterium]